jgi:hypothetical protein
MVIWKKSSQGFELEGIREGKIRNLVQQFIICDSLLIARFVSLPLIGDSFAQSFLDISLKAIVGNIRLGAFHKSYENLKENILKKFAEIYKIH